MAWRELYNFISGKLEAFRRTIDVEEQDREPRLVIETLDAVQQSRAEKFLQKVALSVDALLADEIIRTPSGKAFVPEKFLVFLSPEDDREWQGRKREFIRQELSGIILDEARRRAGKHKLLTEHIEIEFRVDGTLDKDLLRVNAVLEGNRELTVIADTEKTVVFENIIGQPEAARDLQTTFIEPLYKIEVWRRGQLQKTIPIHQREISIGRGSASVPVNVQLRNAGVSRRQAILEFDENDSFWLTHSGANSTLVDGAALPSKQKTLLRPEQEIKICDFTLKIRI